MKPIIVKQFYLETLVSKLVVRVYSYLIILVINAYKKFSNLGQVHIDTNGLPHQPPLIHQPCNVKFYRITPYDLQTYPFIVLVSVGTHTHPPPPPSTIPYAIKERLVELIKTAHEDVVDVMPRNILSGK